MKNHFDLLVIGGGSGGIATAKKAASYGATVALIEADHIGGTCINLGCVPKKIMWYAGEISETYHNSLQYGFECKDYTFNFEKLVANRQKYIAKLNKIYEQQLQDNNINYIKGCAEFFNPHTVKINNEHYTSDHIIIATGSEPIFPSIEGAKYGIDSNGFFNLESLPKKVAIVGAGYIAVELASILNQLGSEIKLFIRHDKLIKNFDSMLSNALMEIMTTQGIQILPHHQVTSIIRNEDGKLKIHCNNDKSISDINSLIFAIGRKPRTQHLNLNMVNVNTDKNGFILTDKWEQTNISHIYAIGDVTGKKLLTPVAIAAGQRLAARIFGNEKGSYLDYDNIPTVIFSHPPIGSVGLSEHDAINMYGKNQLIIYETQFTSLYDSLHECKTLSRMKLIALKPHEKIIGCHIIGPGSDEILQGFAVAIKMGATKKDFEATVAIHPTSAEELVTMK